MGAMNTGDYSNDNFIGQAHRPADPAREATHQATGGASREAGKRRTGAQSGQRRYALCPRRHARTVRALHRAHRARLVFRAAQCGGRAPRSRTGPRVGSAVHRRQAGGGGPQLRDGKPAAGGKDRRRARRIERRQRKGTSVSERRLPRQRRNQRGRRRRAHGLPAPRTPLRRGFADHGRARSAVSAQLSSAA